MTGPWVLAGDFNLTRGAEDKNNAVVHTNLSTAFNNAIDSLALIDLPLLNRRFTWSNKRDEPVLARLDRIFFNPSMSQLFPNSSLSALVASTSDHTPLALSLSSMIPKPSTFRFENAWLHHDQFLPSILQVWAATSEQGDAAGVLARSLKAARGEAKVWARKLRARPTLHSNCKFIINLFDTLEEHRFLSAGERCVRALFQERLQLALRELASYWKQRGKVRELREGDANTQYFQAKATQRLRTNQIRGIEVGGVLVTSHTGKTQALTEHLISILGVTSPTQWHFNLSELYRDSSRADVAPLDAPFTSEEALAAVRAMNWNSAPGPDGFGSSFYQASWNTVSPRIMQFMHAFQAGPVDLELMSCSSQNAQAPQLLMLADPYVCRIAASRSQQRL